LIEKRDSQPLLNILEVVGGWPVAMDKWNETIGKDNPGGSLMDRQVDAGTQNSQGSYSLGWLTALRGAP
jgi:hypothetical protein